MWWADSHKGALARVPLAHLMEGALPAAAAKLTLTKRSEKKVLGGLDLNNDSASSVNNYENGITSKSNNGSSALNNGSSKFLSIGSRSSLDLGTLGRSDVTNGSVGAPTVSSTSPSSSSSMINTANMGRQLSLPNSENSTQNCSGLPAFGGLRSNGSGASIGSNEASTPPSDLTKDQETSEVNLD